MIPIPIGSKIQGLATNASKVDYTVNGLIDNVLSTLANGQLPSTLGDLYTATTLDICTSIILVNTDTVINYVDLYILAPAGTARRVISKNLALGVQYSLYFDGVKLSVYDATGALATSIPNIDIFLDNTAGGTDADVHRAPTSNALYDHGVVVTGIHGAGTDTLLAYTKGTPAQGDMLYFDGSNWVKLVAGTTGKYLKTQGAGANPMWDSVSAFPAGAAQGDIVYYNGSAWVLLTAGTAGYFLKTLGVNQNPAWAAIVTSSNGAYTGNGSGSNRAIAHGLSAAPRIVIIISNNSYEQFFASSTRLWYKAPSGTTGQQTQTAVDTTNFYVSISGDYEHSANWNTYTYNWVALL